MSDWHHVTVIAPGPTGRGAVVLLDGEKVRGVTRIELVIGMNEPNRLVLEMYVASINGEFEVEVEKKT